MYNFTILSFHWTDYVILSLTEQYQQLQTPAALKRGPIASPSKWNWTIGTTRKIQWTAESLWGLFPQQNLMPINLYEHTWAGAWEAFVVCVVHGQFFCLGTTTAPLVLKSGLLIQDSSRMPPAACLHSESGKAGHASHQCCFLFANKSQVTEWIILKWNQPIYSQIFHKKTYNRVHWKNIITSLTLKTIAG